MGPTVAPLQAGPMNVSWGTNTPVQGNLDLSTMSNRDVRRYLRTNNPTLSSAQVRASARGLRQGYNSGQFGADGKLKPEDPAIAALNGTQEQWDAYMKSMFGSPKSDAPIQPVAPKYDIQPITPTLISKEPSPEELRYRARQKRYAGYAQAAKDAGINDVTSMQQQLINAGYDIGKADGLWGPKSQVAYAQWKQAQERSKDNPDPRYRDVPDVPNTGQAQQKNAWDGFTYSQGQNEWWKGSDYGARGLKQDAAGNIYGVMKDGSRNYGYGMLHGISLDGSVTIGYGGNRGINHLKQSRKEFDDWYNKKMGYTKEQLTQGNLGWTPWQQKVNSERNAAYEGWLKSLTGKNSWEQFKQGGKLIPKKYK